MAVEIKELSNIGKFKSQGSRWKMFFFIILAIALIITFTRDGGGFFGTFFLAFLGIGSLCMVPYALYLLFRTMLMVDIKKLHREKETEIKKHGFNIDFSAIGLLVDHKNRKLIFTLDPKPIVYICNFDDVRQWFSGSEVHETQYQNSDGAYAGTRSLTIARHITVRIADPNIPEMRFAVSSDREQSLWIGRLDALING
ncbi:hypothetical protein RMB03_19570 [Acinetobacter sp. V91_7]|uniref:hypothetical protein n=1 Tax=unclassified Acinetobacter TaxID=196816 RepID=UPI00287DA52A|nr:MULTISPECIES: hypothetical protein [unclassified Acinetobacter]MDS7930093.1 hypothetical protein [Acinetobacter sp. V102_4]MDS7933543.1 hypothetical protein [Acinetobacter sp. V91_4B]MDS7965147.1 hypothetical protein [Acinetobacter sp. V91_7]MDS8027646.1 hypothetical protein [Acinetobacter sp. V91_13]